MMDSKLIAEYLRRRCAASLRVALFGAALFAAATSAAANGAEVQTADRGPNILLIFADDLGYGDVSTYHASDVRTPHLDALAESGMLFTNMRANCTVCSPSRAALLTGRYADRVGVPGVIRTHADNSWGFFDPQVRTIANELKALDYHTAIVGKWHLGLESPNAPNDREVDFVTGCWDERIDSYVARRRHGIHHTRRHTREIDPPGHATELFTDWAES